jgi:hypothetical protein
MTKGFPLVFVIREAARIGHLEPKLHRPIPISISPETPGADSPPNDDDERGEGSRP